MRNWNKVQPDRIAVLLDTSVIGEIGLEDILTNSNTDFFVTAGVLAELAAWKPKSHQEERYRRAMDVVAYFRRKEDRIIYDEIDPIVGNYANFTAKSLARDVYNNEFGKTRLTPENIAEFMHYVSRKVRIAFRDAYHRSEQMAEQILDHVGHYAERKMHKLDGYMPNDNPDVDVGIVSAARNLQDLSYNIVRVLTKDRDIDIMVKLCNALYRPGTFQLECSLT